MRRPVLAPVTMLGASGVLFGLMAFVAKLLAGRIGGAQIAFVRFALTALPFLLVPEYRRRASTVRRWDLLFYRGAFGALAVLCYFLAIEHIPVGTASLLNYTSPLFSVTLAALFLDEPVQRRLAIPLLLALAGVGLVTTAGGPLGSHRVDRWELVALASGVLAGAALAAMRAARRTEGSWAVFASFTLLGIVTTGPLALAGWVRPTAQEWMLLAVVGLSSLAGQLLMTHAYRWVDNLRSGSLAQGSVLTSMALGVLFLDEPLGPRRLLGTLSTLAGVLWIVWWSRAQPVAEPRQAGSG